MNQITEITESEEMVQDTEWTLFSFISIMTLIAGQNEETYLSLCLYFCACTSDTKPASCVRDIHINPIQPSAITTKYTEPQ